MSSSTPDSYLDLLRSRDRKTAREAADRLGNVADKYRLVACLTDDEYDWLELLRERLYELSRGRTLHPCAGRPCHPTEDSPRYD